MPDRERVARTIVLVEDKPQQNLVRRYLQRCRGNAYSDRQIDWRPLPAGRGSGEQYVRLEYPKQTRSCRSSLGKRASCLLIVMTDADTRETRKRGEQLSQELMAAEMEPRETAEPIVVLIPKRHVETWIQALLGKEVDEETDYTRAPHSSPSTEQIKRAANRAYDLTRPNTPLDAVRPPSLKASIPEWTKIPP